MKAGLLSPISVLIVVAPSFADKKFRDEVPFRAWNQEQISKVLTKSPWPNEFHISRTKLEEFYRANDSEEQVNAIRRLTQNPAGVVASQRASRSLDNTGDDFGSFIPLIVRWESRIPVR